VYVNVLKAALEFSQFQRLWRAFRERNYDSITEVILWHSKAAQLLNTTSEYRTHYLLLGSS